MQNQIQISSETRIVLDYLLICAIFLALVYIGYQSIESLWSQVTGQMASEIYRWSVGTVLSQ